MLNRPQMKKDQRTKRERRTGANAETELQKGLADRVKRSMSKIDQKIDAALKGKYFHVSHWDFVLDSEGYARDRADKLMKSASGESQKVGPLPPDTCRNEDSESGTLRGSYWVFADVRWRPITSIRIRGVLAKKVPPHWCQRKSEAPPLLPALWDERLCAPLLMRCASTWFIV